MNDRGMIKWAPFNSIVSTQKVMYQIVKEKQKVKMPILSEEQIINITENIYKAYQLGENIQIKYYKDGYFYFQKGKISQINYQNKSITLNNHHHIYLNQIIKINI